MFNDTHASQYAGKPDFSHRRDPFAPHVSDVNSFTLT